MKEYKKPVMMALSISANDQLCGGCAVTTRNNMDWILMLNGIGNITVADSNGDNAISPDETNLFAESGEDCVAWYESYCKFTGAENYKVFTS